MEHLVIGAAAAAPTSEYARSVELATSVRPTIVGWGELCAATPRLGGLAAGPVLVRLCAPIDEEITALADCGGAARLAGAGDVERLPLALLGMERAVGYLESQLAHIRAVPRYATSPTVLGLFLRRDLRRRCLERDGFPLPRVPAGLIADQAQTGAHDLYEALRDHLRRNSGKRVIIRLNHGLGDPPTVVAWMGGRGIRALANCQFTPVGAARCPLHPIEEEGALRPLLGRLFEIGAVVEEEWPCAEIDGRLVVLSLMPVGNRVVLGLLRPRGALPGPPPQGDAPDLLAVRRQIPASLYEKIEETCVRLVQIHRVAALTVDIGVSRRFDRFAVLDVDPFADMPVSLRDATGWSASDHLVRRLRRMGEEPTP